MIIILNNKCNLTKDEFLNYYEKLKNIEVDDQELILCPSYPHLGLTTASSIKIGAQNVSLTGNGAYTGEVSAHQLKSYGVSYAIVGHSERRKNQKETSEEISVKVKNLLEENITPIVCIGEPLEEKDNPQVLDYLLTEFLNSTTGLTEEDYGKIIIAYEPIWAIGTGIIPSNADISLKISFLQKHFPKSKVVYGGSVNENNILELIKNKELDGFLIGGMSLEIDNLKIVLEKLKKGN